MIAAKQITWLFIALIGIACSGWLFTGSRVGIKLDEHTLSTTVDLSIYNLTVHQFDTNGRLINFLHTPFMHHVPKSNTHWLKNPHIIVSQENQPTVDISAQQATALNGGQQITFNNHVIIHQDKDEHTQESTLTSESITYFPKDKLATTLVDITYERAGHTIQALGMKANLAEKRIKLLSQARGTYDPSRG